MRSLLINFLLALSVPCVTFEASSATFRSDELGVALTMTGEISHGDAERLVAIYVAVKEGASGYYRYPMSLYLNSPGGDVTEAIRLAELVKTLGISVAVAPDGNGVCASSCFLIYAAALERNAAGVDTIRKEGAKGNLGPLGVHRPYFRNLSGGPTGAQKQEQLMREMRDYLAKSGVSYSLVDKMMSHASNDIYWLNAEDIRAMGSYSAGVEEQLIARCRYDARAEANMSAREWFESSRSGVGACVRAYMTSTYDPDRAPGRGVSP